MNITIPIRLTAISLVAVIATMAFMIAFSASATANNNDCVEINTADETELATLRHAGENQDRIDEVLEKRPFRNVGQLLDLSFWHDPRQPAEMVDGDVKVCEFDVAAVEHSDGAPFPRIDGVHYTMGRVVNSDIEGTGLVHEFRDRVVFAGFDRGSTTVADFRVFTTTELNENFNWNKWKDIPHRGYMFSL